MNVLVKYTTDYIFMRYLYSELSYDHSKLNPQGGLIIKLVNGQLSLFGTWTLDNELLKYQTQMLTQTTQKNIWIIMRDLINVTNSFSYKIYKCLEVIPFMFRSIANYSEAKPLLKISAIIIFVGQ